MCAIPTALPSCPATAYGRTPPEEFVMNRISAETLHGWIIDGQELALLDAREDGEFGTSHLFWAVPCGLARKEIRARALLPRLTVRVCCVDDGSGSAETLGTWLESIGCIEVSIL